MVPFTVVARKPVAWRQLPNIKRRGGKMHLTAIDWLIMAVYLVFVLGIGFWLRRSIRTSTDFFLSGRSIPAWVCGLAFISANLGAQEVIGMGASGGQEGSITTPSS